jgi:short-subunit dehydrogenase
MASRDTKTMEAVMNEFKTENENYKLTSIKCDLGDSSSIDEFVSCFEKLNLPIHALINNAGVFTST